MVISLFSWVSLLSGGGGDFTLLLSHTPDLDLPLCPIGKVGGGGLLNTRGVSYLGSLSSKSIRVDSNWLSLLCAREYLPLILDFLLEFGL